MSDYKGSSITATVTISTAALILAANLGRKTAAITNTSTSATLYIAPTAAGATSAAGFPLTPGETYIDEDTRGAWYGVASTGSIDVRTDEVS